MCASQWLTSAVSERVHKAAVLSAARSPTAHQICSLAEVESGFCRDDSGFVLFLSSTISAAKSLRVDNNFVIHYLFN